MPSPVLKSLADKAGVSIKRAEHLWEQAKKIANKNGKFKKDGEDEYYAYVTGIVKRMLSVSKGRPNKARASLAIEDFLHKMERELHPDSPISNKNLRQVNRMSGFLDAFIGNIVSDVANTTGGNKDNRKQELSDLVSTLISTGTVHSSMDVSHAASIVSGHVLKCDTVVSSILQGMKELSKSQEEKEQDKWEALASKVIKAIYSDGKSLDDIVKAVGASKEEVKQCLQEFVKLDAAKSEGGIWSLTLDLVTKK